MKILPIFRPEAPKADGPSPDPVELARALADSASSVVCSSTIAGVVVGAAVALLVR